MKQVFRLKCELSADTVEVSILNAQVIQLGRPVLEVDEHSRVLQFPQRKTSDFAKLSELCAGIGGLGQGAKYAGWEIAAQNVSSGGRGSLQARYPDQKYERDPDGACLGWGFSCQPFSKLGDGQQGLDSRSATLPFGLFAAHILRKDLLIMECVTEASTSAFVQKCLEYHLKLTLSEKAETFLSLADIWPAKRRRWWTVITKAFMGKVQLNPFPVLPQKPTWSSLLADFRTQASHPISPRV